MTVRGVVLGLLLAALISAVGYINDFVLDLTFLIGNHFPILVFGGLVLFLMLGNPLLRMVGLELTRGEIATIVALVLAIGVVPSSGLLRTFSVTTAMPAHLAAGKADWTRNNVLSYVPDKMLATRYDEGRVSGKLIEGMGRSNKRIGIQDVPWGMSNYQVKRADGSTATEQVGWTRPLAFWMPVVVLTFVGLLGLGVVVHRQWSANELLRYPIVEFANGALERQEGRVFSRVFHDRLFWIGLGAALLVHVINGRFAWYGTGIKVDLLIDITTPLRELFPNLEKGGKAWGVMSPKLFITVAAFSYLLASEIGLSIGISNLVYCITAAGFIRYGMTYNEDYWMGGVFSYQTFGSFLGVALVILYTGRNFYWAVLRRTLGLPSRQQVPSYSVWGARVFLGCMAAATAWLVVEGGIDWMLAIVVMLLITLMLLVVGRINAETGLFFIQPGWPVIGCIVGLFGMEALGAKMFILMGLVVTVLAADPRESIMPFVLNGLKLSEKADLRPSRVAPWMAVALLLGLAVGVPAVLWAQYNWGTSFIGDNWGAEQVPAFTFQSASLEIDKLTAAGTLNAAGQHWGLSRLSYMRPNPQFLWAAGIGLGLVLLLNGARMRWTWWPIHPVLFLVWASVPLAHFAPSFLVGWVIRALVVKLGGGKAYQRVKPLMYGLIAGDLLGGLLFMGIGAGYYLLNASTPKNYQIFPF